MKVEIKPAAIADLDQIFDYISEESPASAWRVVLAVRKMFSNIAKNPGVGTLRRFRSWPDIRSRRVKGYPNYLIFFRVQNEIVEILRVLHSKRDLPRFFE